MIEMQERREEDGKKAGNFPFNFLACIHITFYVHVISSGIHAITTPQSQWETEPEEMGLFLSR